ncbi:unnamed protein product [Microthlaspi erraticum]|uniref:Retrotransposon Copia-like N-terminal domain-containing protein n=1 Tax=Microthlaspi erraticum TaxID=1685480 RepID=A0A6D2I2Z5_9BRAS|nr:unnamed protein product [Microthlaspi erraticum]
MILGHVLVLLIPCGDLSTSTVSSVNVTDNGGEISGTGYESRIPSGTQSFEVSDSPDNIHSPFHLHSSDHPGLVLASELLDGTDYGLWLVAMTTSLEAKNKIGFIDGSIPIPAETDPYYKIWCCCNSMFKSWLLNSVSKKIYASIMYFRVAADIWKDVNTREPWISPPIILRLRLTGELSSLQVTSRTAEDLLAERETNRRSARLVPNSGIEPSAFQVASNPSVSAFQKPRPVCSHCGGLGHIVYRCYKKHGYPPGMKYKGRFQKPSASTNLVINSESPMSPTESAPSVNSANFPPAALTPDQM